MGVSLCIGPIPFLVIMLPACSSLPADPKAEDDAQSVLAACAGHRNDSGIRRKCWPVAVVPRIRIIKCMALWRNICLLNSMSAFFPCLMLVGVFLLFGVMVVGFRHLYFLIINFMIIVTCMSKTPGDYLI